MHPTLEEYFDSLKAQYNKWMECRNFKYRFTDGYNIEFHNENGKVIRFNKNQLNNLTTFIYAAWWLERLSTNEVIDLGIDINLMPTRFRFELDNEKRETLPYRHELLKFVDDYFKV